MRGQRCRRPSGHLADVLHAARYQVAEAIDAANGVVYQAGDLYEALDALEPAP